MSYLNVDLDYFDHPQTVMLISLLGRGAEVLPLKLWRTCGKFYSKDGRLTGYSAEAIELAVGWWGEKGKAVAAMMDKRVDYLGQEPDGTFYAKKWLVHNGHIAALQERSRAANTARWNKYREEKAIQEGRAVGLHKDNFGSPPSVRPSKKEGARGAGTETADSGTFGVPKPRYCTCGNRIYDSGKACLECSCCSQCKEPSEDLKLDAGQDLRLCPSCRKENQ